MCFSDGLSCDLQYFNTENEPFTRGAVVTFRHLPCLIHTRITLQGNEIKMKNQMSGALAG